MLVLRAADQVVDPALGLELGERGDGACSDSGVGGLFSHMMEATDTCARWGGQSQCRRYRLRCHGRYHKCWHRRLSDISSRSRAGMGSCACISLRTR